MRSAYLDIYENMSLAMVIKINVRMTLVFGHVGSVLLNVHCALHP